MEHRRELISTTVWITVALAVILLLTQVLFGIAIVKGTSMYPELNEGDVVVYWRLSGSYERGDIVLVETGNVREDYIKRVCGLPDETFTCSDSGDVLIDGQTLNEPYIYQETYSKNGGTQSVALNAEQYYVMGDNRGDSRDSRDYGSVSKECIDGKVIMILRTY